MKKLTGNGLWESSRMMLFEHRDAIITKQEEKHKQPHPLLDEQQAERVAEKLSLAYRSKQPVQLTVFGEYGNYSVTGTITRIDTFQQRVFIRESWIPLADILEAADGSS